MSQASTSTVSKVAPIPRSRGSTPSLRTHLKSSLKSIQNPYPVHLTVLSSTPRRTSSLFPHAEKHLAPRCWEKEYLVTLSVTVRPPHATGEASGLAGPSDLAVPTGPSLSENVSALTPPIPNSPAPPSQFQQPPPSHPAQPTNPPNRVLVTALSAHLYTLPSSTSSPKSILYISKLDSSGHLPAPQLSLTRKLIISFLTYFLSPLTRPTAFVQVNLFARSQGQYLFANSSLHGGKKVLGGVGLCGWWKAVLEEVGGGLLNVQGDAQAGEGTDVGTQGIGQAGQVGDRDGEGFEEGQQVGGVGKEIRLRYILPSYDEAEARSLLGIPRKTLPPGLSWGYAPPFPTPLPPLPPIPTTSTSLPVPTSSPATTAPGPSEVGPHTSLALMIPSLPDDPKTRFLDELIMELDHPLPPPLVLPPNPTPTSTSTPTLACTSPHNQAQPQSQTQTLEEKKRSRKQIDSLSDEVIRRKSHSALSRISSSEFWERIGFRQECAQDPTGFFCISSGTPTTNLVEGNGGGGGRGGGGGGGGGGEGEVPHVILERLKTALLNCDFATLPLAIEGTGIWLESVQRIVSGEIGEEGWNECVGEILAKENVLVDNGRKREEEVVTVLQPRKKKKLQV